MCHVAAARNVSSHWILKTIDFNRHNCFSIVWGLGSQPIALGYYDSCYMTQVCNYMNTLQSLQHDGSKLSTYEMHMDVLHNINLTLQVIKLP